MLKRLVRSYLPRFVRVGLQKRRKVRELACVRVEEEPDLKVVSRLIERGDTVVDAGANYGLYTCFLSDLVGDSGKVLSFEPIPSTFSVLKHVIQELGLANVVAYERALSDQKSMVAMRLPNFDNGGENPYQAHVTTSSPTDGSAEYKVQASALDDMISNEGPVQFVKIDVEGHEAACLRGARGTLERDRPALLIEISSDLDDPATKEESPIIKLVDELGYLIYWFDGTSLRRRATGDSSVNYFLLQNSHVKKLVTLIAP